MTVVSPMRRPKPEPSMPAGRQLLLPKVRVLAAIVHAILPTHSRLTAAEMSRLQLPCRKAPQYPVGSPHHAASTSATVPLPQRSVRFQSLENESPFRCPQSDADGGHSSWIIVGMDTL